MDMLCCKCKKRPAMLFVAKFDGKEMVNEGYCLKCASELGLPQVKSMMDQLGITQQDLEEFDSQMDEGVFEMGGAGTMPSFLQKMFGGPDEEGIVPTEEEPEQPAAPSSSSSSSSSRPSRREKKSRHKHLDTFCTNLNDKVRAGQMDRIIGRE